MTYRLILLIVIMFTAASVQAQSPAFEQLKMKFDNGMVFVSDFDYEYIDSYTGETNSSTGQIWIDGVGYKVETRDQILLVDGELSKVYDSSKNRVIISEYEVDEDDFAPSKMLSGIDDTYEVSEQAGENGYTIVLLETEDDFADYLTVEIELSPQGTPVKITAYDFAENMSITKFRNGQFGENTGDIFMLSYPDDAEIVDMRY